MTLSKRIVTVLDYTALILAFLSLALFVGSVFVHVVHDVIYDTIDIFRSMWTDRDDRIILGVVAVAVLWCGIRWNAITKRN